MSTPDPSARRADLAQRIDAALLGGTSTTELRARLATLDREIAHAEQAAQDARDAAEHVRLCAIEARAQTTVTELATRRIAVMDDIHLPQPFEVTMVSDTITNAARDLERAAADLLEAGEALTAALDHSDTVAARAKALDAARAAIVARRAAGDVSDDDGPLLETIRADVEGLAPLAVQAGAALTQHARATPQPLQPGPAPPRH